MHDARLLCFCTYLGRRAVRLQGQDKQQGPESQKGRLVTPKVPGPMGELRGGGGAAQLWAGQAAVAQRPCRGLHQP